MMEERHYNTSVVTGSLHYTSSNNVEPGLAYKQGRASVKPIVKHERKNLGALILHAYLFVFPGGASLTGLASEERSPAVLDDNNFAESN